MLSWHGTHRLMRSVCSIEINGLKRKVSMIFLFKIQVNSCGAFLDDYVLRFHKNGVKNVKRVRLGTKYYWILFAKWKLVFSSSAKKKTFHWLVLQGGISLEFNQRYGFSISMEEPSMKAVKKLNCETRGCHKDYEMFRALFAKYISQYPKA